MRIFGMVTTEKSSRYTPYALSSFFRHTKLTKEDIFLLIDNDASCNLDIEAFPHQITILKNQSPLGFAENANHAVYLALENKADLIFMNNDLVFSNSWLEPLYVNDTCIYSPLSNRELQYNTDFLKLKVSVDLDHYIGNENVFDYIAEQHKKQFTGYHQVLVAPFFCVRIPYQILSAVGLFDTRFGKGGAEDYDYCLRTYLSGFAVRYALTSYVLHFGGKSSWGSGESQSEQESRESKFRSEFSEKWGEALGKIILFEQIDLLKEYEGLSQAIKDGDYQLVINSLRPATDFPIAMF